MTLLTRTETTDTSQNVTPFSAVAMGTTPLPIPHVRQFSFALQALDPIAHSTDDTCDEPGSATAAGGHHVHRSYPAMIQSADATPHEVWLEPSDTSSVDFVIRDASETEIIGSIGQDILAEFAQPPVDTDLASALRDLDEVIAEAREEEIPVPSRLAIENAKRLLLWLYSISPRRFEVYPTPDAEIAIDAPSDRGSVILLCDSYGGALCMVNLDGNHRRARYSSSNALPDGFVREALADLDV